MIKTFNSKETEGIYHGWLSASRYPQDGTGYKLERHSGNRAGQYSIRINDQWLVCFVWRDGDAYDVQIVDYQIGFMSQRDYEPIHPGEILFDEFLKQMGITQLSIGKRR